MLRDLWPSHLQQLEELRQLSAAQQPEFDRAWRDLQQLHLEFSPYTLTERGCARWEEILEIYTAAGRTLEERRFAIAARLNANLPYTAKRLEQVLEELCGAGYYTIEQSGYQLTVRLALVSKQNMQEAAELVGRMIPANIAAVVSLLFNRHSMLAGYTHAQLAARTHQMLRDEVLP